MTVQILQVLEWAGGLTGLAGAALLALNIPISRWGWVVCLASNILLILFAAFRDLDGILTMQLGFTAISVIGIVRSFRPDPGQIDLRLSRLGRKAWDWR